MRENYFYIADGQMFYRDKEKDVALQSGVLDAYVARIRESAKRNEWKYQGEGAKFTGSFAPGQDAESRVASIQSAICCLGHTENKLLYSLRLDGSVGIYSKISPADNKEGILLSDAGVAYRDFDYFSDRLAVSAATGGESHIGVLEKDSTLCKTYTDGHSFDFSPVWSRTNPDDIYFCTRGLPVDTAEEERPAEKPLSYPEMVRSMMEAGEAQPKGSASISLLHLKEGTLDEILSGDAYDYLHPQSTSDGSLYYIRRPFRREAGTRPFGCLVDILLFPVRLLAALFGFFNVFSMQYSGKALSHSGDAKRRDEGKIFIDGNLISAEKELKENSHRGEKNPGIIPRSWELHRLDKNGEDTLIRRGVVAYRVEEQSGDILFSNGSALLCRHADGTEQCISKTDRITFIL